MRILVVGGTRFVGRHLVEQAGNRGHQVTVFHRGRTGVDLFPDVEHRIGDRDRDLAALAESTWDATVDTCAYLPRQVHALADVLGARGGRHLLVSSVSAYQPPPAAGITEDAPLAELDDPDVDEVTDVSYGGLKVRCERAAVERYGPETLLVRPTYVVGPDDYTWRFPWWVERLSRGGEVLVPGPADAPAQLVDVRDLGSFMVGLIEGDLAGDFHAVSPQPPFSWRDEIEAIRAEVAPEGTVLTWVDAQFLLAEGVHGRDLPLWGEGDVADGYLMAADPAKSYAAGLAPRPLLDTVRDTLDTSRCRPPRAPSTSASACT